ncbi:MAG: hypothetical protein M3220_05320 [Chloroflexota bacterium]|nr:hypothetical protein [Chloroflexota bacterium]
MSELLRVELEEILRHEPDRFSTAVRTLRDRPQPPTRDDLMKALLELRESMRAEGDERRENLVLDMLDWIVGWCSPGSQPFPPSS